MGGAGQDFWEDWRDANQFMFCGLQTMGWAVYALVRKNKTHQLRNEAQLNCVALRPQLDYEVGWRAVKGQDERQKTAPLTALHPTREITAKSEKKILRRAATSALTFVTFS